MIIRIVPLAVAAFGLAFASTAMAETSWSYQARSTDAPSFTRPNANGTPSTVVAPFHVQPFSVSRDLQCFVYSSQDYDGFLALYRDAFDSNFPTVNFLAGDDDGDLGAGTSKIPVQTIQAGRPHFLVTTAFAANGSGTFENTLHCQGGGPDDNGTIVHGDCTGVTDGTAGCLHKDRFEFEVQWRDFRGNTGDGTVSPFGASDSANVWFFSPDNWELLIKVLDFCGQPNKRSFSVYFSATTNMEFTLRVRDTATGQVNTYTNPLGQRADTVIDDFAFSCP